GLTQVYMDLLRLEVGSQFQFVPAQVTLRRVQVLGPDGLTPVTIYYRQNQRRPRIETDGEFCLSQAETGLQFPRNAAPTGTATPPPRPAARTRRRAPRTRPDRRPRGA